MYKCISIFLKEVIHTSMHFFLLKNCVDLFRCHQMSPPGHVAHHLSHQLTWWLLTVPWRDENTIKTQCLCMMDFTNTKSQISESFFWKSPMRVVASFPIAAVKMCCALEPYLLVNKLNAEKRDLTLICDSGCVFSMLKKQYISI